MASSDSSSSSAYYTLLDCLNLPKIDAIKPQPDEPIEYFTDVEGNLDYFRNWLCLSSLLKEIPASDLPPSEAAHYNDFCLDFASPRGFFVFGGDVVDKGPADIRITRALISLKLRHPDRVFFILGNRDINKLRFAIELAANVPGSEIPVLWDPKHTTFSAWLLKKRAQKAPLEVEIKSSDQNNNNNNNLNNNNNNLNNNNLNNNNNNSNNNNNENENRVLIDDVDVDDSKNDADDPSPPLGSIEDRTLVCQWMMECTMGSPTTFELRRHELGLLKGEDPALVADAEVTESFMKSADRLEQSPMRCFMLAFLALGQLALRAGHALFVHGSVNDQNCGLLPSGSSVAGVDEWVSVLNDWKHLRVAEFVQYGIPPHDFMTYAVGMSPTVVYSSYLANGNGRFPSQQTVDFLRQSGVAMVLAGHAPHGDCPLVMRDARLTVLTADTSYSDASAADNRGIAVSAVTLCGERVLVSGILASGKSHRYELAPLVSPREDEVYVGKQVEPDGAWVKTYCPETERYLAVKGEGYRLISDWIV